MDRATTSRSAWMMSSFRFGRSALSVIAALSASACGVLGADLFTGGAGGSPSTGGAGGTGGTMSSSVGGAVNASSQSSSSGFNVAASSSSSGGPRCGNGICEVGEDSLNCHQDCESNGSAGPGGSGGGGTCDHPACDTGNTLDPSCDPCAATVCASDDYCCNTAWDGQCVDEADEMCGPCCGNGECNNSEGCNSCEDDCGACPVMPTCPHSACFVGDALDPMDCRDPCADEVCAQMGGCCGGPNYGGDCQTLATMLCGADPCITDVCAAMPACCTNGWTQACVDQAKTTCNTQCNCAHSICTDGDKLDPGCNPCAAAVCTVDDYCCNAGWDGICVGEVATICGIVCGPR